MGYSTRYITTETARKIIHSGDYVVTEWTHGGIIGSGSEVSFEISDHEPPRIYQTGLNRSFQVWEKRKCNICSRGTDKYCKDCGYAKEGVKK